MVLFDYRKDGDIIKIKYLAPLAVGIGLNTIQIAQANGLSSLSLKQLSTKADTLKRLQQMNTQVQQDVIQEKQDAEKEQIRLEKEEQLRLQEALAAKQRITNWQEKQRALGDTLIPMLSQYASTYPIGQCTWGVAQVAKFVGPYWGNANQWVNSAKREGYEVGTEPRHGAIMVWTYGQYGHVAYVTDVREDGFVKIIEANYGANGLGSPMKDYRGWFNPELDKHGGEIYYIYNPEEPK